jgi:branched-chain amino acid transport system permease protein
VSEFIQLVVSGVAAGTIYGIAALGFTLLWQASGTINFAQGEFVMVPAFAMLFFLALGAPLWAAFVATCGLSMLVLGGAFKRIVVDPLLHHGVIPLVIATLGLSVFMKQGVKAGIGAMPQPFPSIFPSGQFALGGINLSFADVGTLVLAVVAALLVTPSYLAKFDMGETIGLKAFFAAIIGGFNQTRGALLGGVLIGVLENLVGFYVTPAYKEGVALVVFLLVILLRPEGLLGKVEERKV